MEYKVDLGRTPLLFRDIKPGELFRFPEGDPFVLIRGTQNTATRLNDGCQVSYPGNSAVVLMKHKDGLPVFVDA